MEATRGGGSRSEANDSVKVVVRVRPLNGKERHEQTKSCVRITSSPDGLSSNNIPEGHAPQQLIVGKDRAFTFDEVFGIDSTQKDVYRNTVEPLVDGFLEGYNATVLAYGQTGTGKTHTMSGTSVDPKGGKSDDLPGIIPRVIRATFEKMQNNQQRKEYSLRVEYIEIYNEELRDLLHPETPSKQLSIREDGEGNIVMAGVKSEVAQTKEAVLRLLTLGGASRVTGSTLMNEQSSRSHAIFSLIVHQRDLATGECRKAKFHLVDLAGSERAKRTGAVAGRFKESVSINQGLLALGNVISALSDEKRKLGATSDRTASGTSSSTAVHVPYRDSKLTRLLQDSLGGNAKTLMVACVSPAALNFEETLNTLKYANRAKNIKNRPIVNQQTQEEKQKADDEIARMKEEIALLQSQLQSTSHPATPSTAGTSTRPETSSSSSSRHRRHSVAVSTSTASVHHDAATEQELAHLRKKCRAYADTIEAMRGLNVDAITSLVAMEREIKPLGRPVQHQLNEIVKMLNAAVQTVGSVESSLRKSLSVVPGEGEGSKLRGSMQKESASVDDETYKRLKKELNEAKSNLARDEQIFEMKNAEIKRLQECVGEAKVKNEKLIQRVQELERGGQLWSNPRHSVDGSRATGDQTRTSGNLPKPSKADPQQASNTSTDRVHHSVELDPSNKEDALTKRSTSSRGLFTKRATTGGMRQSQEDIVLLGNEEDEAMAPRVTKTQGKPGQIVRRSGGGASHRSSVAASEEQDGSMSKMEKMLATLRAKVEELQHQNGELVHEQEEACCRWQLERQQYERQLNDAEQALEGLRKANQALEDTLIEHPTAPRAVCVSTKNEIVMDANGRLETPEHRPTTAVQTQSLPQVMELLDSSIRRLIEFNQARQQVIHLIKEKKVAQQNADETNRRLNAIEMQKLRQSMQVRESIVDVSASLRSINDQIQRETKTVEEIERLTKLRDRAEKKLRALRRQEEREEFLDKGTQQEMADLEELLEDLNSHITFQDAELTTARQEMERIRERAQLDEQSPLASMTQALVDHIGVSSRHSVVAAAMIQKCLEDIARLRAREQQLLSQVNEHEATILERDAALNQLEHGLLAARKEFDRRLQLQVQESREAIEELQRQVDQLSTEAKDRRHLDKLQPQSLELESVKDEEWQKLIVSNQKKDEYITTLEKHVVFYKAKAKQMQMQLQQLIRDSAGNQEDHGDVHEDSAQLKKRIQQLEEANDALMKDLATAKVYLRLSKSRSSAEGAQVVRVSKSELRELPQPPTSATSSARDED